MSFNRRTTAEGMTRAARPVTSREPLGISGDVTFPVPPLTTPTLDQFPGTRDLEGFEAVCLFVDRAAATRPGFALDDANAQALARICSRLDGLPLAIELAAARARSMSSSDIVQRIDDRFSLLSRGGRTAAPRHQTLRATIDWSHELLTEEERTLFRRLTVFAGGWRLGVGESVCADDRLPREEIVDVHARVADKSLIVAEPLGAGAGRHRLLQTIRQFSAERLAEAGEVDFMRRRHFGQFLDVSERGASLEALSFRLTQGSARLILMTLVVSNLISLSGCSDGGLANGAGRGCPDYIPLARGTAAAQSAGHDGGDPHCCPHRHAGEGSGRPEPH
jgi:predicted ATPase